MASTCCEIGLWSPIIAARISREHLGCRSSGLEIGGRNTGTPRRLAVTHGLVSARKVLGSVVVGSIGRRSGAPWQQVVYRASASKRSDGLKMFQSARGVRSYSGLPQRLGSFSLDFSSLEVASEDVIDDVRLPALTAALSAFSLYPGIANASTLNPAYGDVGAFLEAGVQLIYLGALLVLLGVGSFLVVRQVLIKRELETAAKDLQDRVRSGEASSLEFFELGAVMLRKKYFQLANKYLDQAIKKWDGSEQDLAQVYNALGFSYFSDGKVEKAIAQYEKAVQLQPGYVTAWNNLADAYENQKDFAKALTAYEQALQFDPTNKVASARRDFMKSKVDRFQGIP